MEFWQVSPAFHSIFRHEKKVLALVLAFACAFTMFAGAASFTDEADISENNRDAVELLTTLKIIKGYEDGSFDPEGTVDRAEMAKMIYTIRNGGNDNASAHVGNTTSFTDISGHWAEGYIKYLQNTGIVAGKSATQFAPDAQVTTAEAMKMALALAGYDEENAGLTGIDWQKNTLTYATTIGLTDDVNSAMSAGCSRQDAAQILANVLEANAVRYSAIVENFVNDSKTGLSYGGDPITVGNKWMDLSVYVGRMTSSGELYIDGTKAGKDSFKVDVDTVDGKSYNPGRGGNSVLTFKDGQDHTDLVGMEVKVLTGEKIDEVYGVYATDTSNVVETTTAAIDVVDFDSANDTAKLKVDGETYDTVDAAVYQDLKHVQTVGDYFTENGEKVADTVKMIDWDDNGDYETILVNTVNVAELNYLGSKSLTLGDAGSKDSTIRNKTMSLDLDDVTIYEDAAKGDYVVFTKNVYDDTWNIEEATAVSGTVNGRVINERKVRIDGDWYTLANNAAGAEDDNTDLYTIQTSRSEFTNGDEVTLYVVGDIVYMAKSATGNDANRTVLMVYETQSHRDDWNDINKAKVILANGDKDTVTISSDSEVAFDEIEIGQMYSYDINNDDEFLLTELDDDDESTLAGYDNAYASTGITSGKVANTAIADDAVVFAMIGANDAKVYTGKQVKDAAEGANYGNYAGTAFASAAQQALIQSEGGFTYARMFNIAIDELNSIVNYGWLLSDSVMSRDENGDKVMEYTFWDGNEMRTDMQRTNRDLRELDAGTLITFLDDGEGYIKDVRAIDSGDGLTEAAITAADGNKIAIIRMEGVNTFEDVIEADSDTKVIYVDSNADSNEDKCVDEEGYGHYAGYDGNNRWINALYIMDDSNENVDFILIDVDGHLKGYDSLESRGGLTATVKADERELTYNASDNQTVTVTLRAENFNSADKTVKVEKVTKDGTEIATTDLGISAVTMNNNGVARPVITVNAGADVGEYAVTFMANGAEAIATFTINPAVISEGYSGFTPSLNKAPAAGDRLVDLTATVTPAAGTTEKSTITAKTADGKDITSENLKAGDVVTLTITLTTDGNHVFDTDPSNSDLNGTTSGQVQGVNGNKMVVSETTATVTYEWTLS